MKRLYLIALFSIALLFAGCQTPADRLALSTLQTADASLDTAYRAWVVSWKARYKAAADTAPLITERNEVARLVANYQAVHKAMLADAESALKASNSGVLILPLDQLNAAKGDLLNVLTH